MTRIFVEKDDRIFEHVEALANLYNGNPADLIKLVREMKISRSQAEKIIDIYCRKHNYSEERREKCILDLKF
jgi:hypothetical protein